MLPCRLGPAPAWASNLIPHHGFVVMGTPGWTWPPPPACPAPLAQGWGGSCSPSLGIAPAPHPFGSSWHLREGYKALDACASMSMTLWTHGKVCLQQQGTSLDIPGDPSRLDAGKMHMQRVQRYWRQILNYPEYSKEMPSEMRALTLFRITPLKVCARQILPGEIMGFLGITPLACLESKNSGEGIGRSWFCC